MSDTGYFSVTENNRHEQGENAGEIKVPEYNNPHTGALADYHLLLRFGYIFQYPVPDGGIIRAAVTRINTH